MELIIQNENEKDRSHNTLMVITSNIFPFFSIKHICFIINIEYEHKVKKKVILDQTQKEMTQYLF